MESRAINARQLIRCIVNAWRSPPSANDLEIDKSNDYRQNDPPRRSKVMQPRSALLRLDHMCAPIPMDHECRRVE